MAKKQCPETSAPIYCFNRRELAGGFGDMGTLLPIALAMILFNGLSPMGVFFSVGMFYMLSGVYYGITVPVQPMKVIGAYVLASGFNPSQITASAILVGVILLVAGGTNAIGLIGKFILKPVVRGIQISTGALLMAQGVRLIAGNSKVQAMYGAAEPYMAIQSVGPVPIWTVFGILGFCVSLYFLENKKFPAGLIVVFAGLLAGVFLGTHEAVNFSKIGAYVPEILPFGFPSNADFTFVLFALVLPQLPMTIGNAVLANADLSREYFGENSKKVTTKALCISMGLANVFSSLIGGMPLCHGAGGLAAHYRFGARTAGSNIMVGAIFILLAVLLGDHVLGILRLMPMSVLGSLLIFAGGQLAMTIVDVRERKDIFVIMIMLSITLGLNLAVGFLVGAVLSYILKSDRFSV